MFWKALEGLERFGKDWKDWKGLERIGKDMRQFLNRRRRTPCPYIKNYSAFFIQLLRFCEREALLYLGQRSSH